MSVLLILLITGCVIATATALIRGLRAFFLDSEHIRSNSQTPLEPYGVQQNRMMSQRVFYQGLAIVLVALIGALAGSR